MPPLSAAQEMYPASTNPAAIDLLEKLLQFNPANRCAAAEALRHPYLSAYHDEVLGGASAQLDESMSKLFDSTQVRDCATLKELILAEARHFG
jgi:serine/threonine protein kinase